MAFVCSRENVGFFGIINGENIDVFPENSNFSSTESGFQHAILTLNDNMPVNVELPSKNVCVEKDDAQNAFISASISDCGHFIAATDNKKFVFLWKREKGEWEPVSRRSLLRRAYKVMFTRQGSEMVVADKGGDLFTFSVTNFSENGKLILGHISIVLDMAMTDRDQYIITSDRDSKIRVSHYPNCYNIYTYCLGHEEFVSALQILRSPEFLMSSSGDGTLKLWQYKQGKQLSSYEFSKDFVKSSTLQLNSGTQNVVTEDSKQTRQPLSKRVKVMRYCSPLSVIATLFYDMPTIDVFQIDDTTLQHVQSLSLKCNPVDAFFSGDNLLWVILSSKPPTVASFRCAVASDMQFTETTQMADNTLASEINNKLLLSKLTIADQINFIHLLNQYVSFTHDVEKCSSEPNAKKNKTAD